MSMPGQTEENCGGQRILGMDYSQPQAWHVHRLYRNFYVGYPSTLCTKAKPGLEVPTMVASLYEFAPHGSHNAIDDFSVVLKNSEVRIQMF
jgi:hypothetical protein